MKAHKNYSIYRLCVGTCGMCVVVCILVWVGECPCMTNIANTIPYSLLFANTASEIKQMYPLDPDYCCHCPAIELQCTFSESPLNAYWSYQSANGVSEDVTSETTGHTVDESMMHQGILYLHVNASVHLKNKMYTCTALYNGGRDLEAETSVLPFMTPMEESMLVYVYVAIS